MDDYIVLKHIDILLTMARYTRVGLLIFIITYFFNYDEYHDLWIWIVKTYTDRLTEIRAKYIVRWKLLDLWYDVVKLCSTVTDTLYVWRYKLMTASVPGQVLRDIKEPSTDPNPTRSPHNQAMLNNETYSHILFREKNINRS